MLEIKKLTKLWSIVPDISLEQKYEGLFSDEIDKINIKIGDQYIDCYHQELDLNYQSSYIGYFDVKKEEELQLTSIHEGLNIKGITFLEEKVDNSMNYEVGDKKVDEGSNPSITDLSTPVTEKEGPSIEKDTEENAKTSIHEDCNIEVKFQTINISCVINSTIFGELYPKYKKKSLNRDPVSLRTNMNNEINDFLDREGKRIDVMNSAEGRIIKRVSHILRKLVVKESTYKSANRRIYEIFANNI